MSLTAALDVSEPLCRPGTCEASVVNLFCVKVCALLGESAKADGVTAAKAAESAAASNFDRFRAAIA